MQGLQFSSLSIDKVSDLLRHELRDLAHSICFSTFDFLGDPVIATELSNIAQRASYGLEDLIDLLCVDNCVFR